MENPKYIVVCSGEWCDEPFYYCNQCGTINDCNFGQDDGYSVAYDNTGVRIDRKDIGMFDPCTSCFPEGERYYHPMQDIYDTEVISEAEAKEIQPDLDLSLLFVDDGHRDTYPETICWKVGLAFIETVLDTTEMQHSSDIGWDGKLGKYVANGFEPCFQVKSYDLFRPCIPYPKHFGDDHGGYSVYVQCRSVKTNKLFYMELSGC
jgi:hypothetical protein